MWLGCHIFMVVTLRPLVTMSCDWVILCVCITSHISASWNTVRWLGHPVCMHYKSCFSFLRQCHMAGSSPGPSIYRKEKDQTQHLSRCSKADTSSKGFWLSMLHWCVLRAKLLIMLHWCGLKARILIAYATLMWTEGMDLGSLCYTNVDWRKGFWLFVLHWCALRAKILTVYATLMWTEGKDFDGLCYTNVDWRHGS